MHAPTPRKRDANATRRRILDAAKHAFSETGYSHTGIRDIAAMAGTSSTLLLRYFESKAGLFEAALRDSMPNEGLTDVALAEFVERYPELIIHDERTTRPLMMIAMASGDPESARIAAQVFSENSIAPIARLLEGPDARVRSLQISILTFGMTFFMKHLPLEGVSADEREQIIAWYQDKARTLLTRTEALSPN